MSIVTLCPQCKTAFAIQAEHYSAADAWVRCGRCAHVFEVDQHLFEIDPTDSDTQPVAHAVPSPEPVVAPTITPSLPLSSPPWQPAGKPSSVFVLTLSFFAALFLMGQVLMFQRDKLVAMNVGVSPLFNRVCQSLGCSIAWPKENDKVAIDSSQFKQIDGSQFSFTLTVKNQAAYFLAAPALELTLTNEEQGDVIRKVWAPQEIGLLDVLKPMRTQTVEMVFAVDEPWAGKIKGYRALLFYP